jgi:hypothetical protein
MNDVQGINWETLPLTRAQYREVRLSEYRNYESDFRRESELFTCDYPDESGNFFNYQSSLFQRCSIVHFQLRHLLAAPNNNSVIFSNNSNITLYNPITRNTRVLIDSSLGGVVGICTLNASNDILSFGGIKGEVITKNINTSCSSKNLDFMSVSKDPNGIITCIDFNYMPFYDENVNPSYIYVSCNDKHVRSIDLVKYKTVKEIKLDFSVNVSISQYNSNKVLQNKPPRHNYLCCR